MTAPDADRTPLWLFGDQLGPHFRAAGRHRGRPIVLIESEHALASARYHRQKLHLVLAGIRRLADELGDRARLIRAPDYRTGLEQVGRPVLVHEPGSYAAERLVQRLQRDGLVEEVLPTPGFLLSRTEFADWADGRQRLLMEDFYRDQRRRFGVLLEADGSPAGGQWNLDQQNRRPPPRRSTLNTARPWQPRESSVDREVRRDLDAMTAEGRIDPVGRDGPRRFAVTRSEALRALDRFLAHRLPDFGPHQDAMLTADWSMAHALLSVPMNLGLLDPEEVVRRAEERYRDGTAPLASTEGFIRQVLGWREWIWQLYWHFGAGYRRRNAFRARTDLPEWWWELDADAVQARCLQTAVAGVRDRGYAHHIQRLMVLGNHALQRGYRPDELTDWFATAFVDGFPWVMPVNVIGMSQHADGGLMATKPYVSGGAYIDRMSDYCRDCRFDPKVRVGEDACPFAAGYWAFLDKHRELLADNRRMRQPLRGLDRLSDREALVRQERRRTVF